MMNKKIIIFLALSTAALELPAPTTCQRRASSRPQRSEGLFAYISRQIERLSNRVRNWSLNSDGVQDAVCALTELKENVLNADVVRQQICENVTLMKDGLFAQRILKTYLSKLDGDFIAAEQALVDAEAEAALKKKACFSSSRVFVKIREKALLTANVQVKDKQQVVDDLKNVKAYIVAKYNLIELQKHQQDEDPKLVAARKKRILRQLVMNLNSFIHKGFYINNIIYNGNYILKKYVEMGLNKNDNEIYEIIHEKRYLTDKDSALKLISLLKDFIEQNEYTTAKRINNTTTKILSEDDKKLRERCLKVFNRYFDDYRFGFKVLIEQLQAGKTSKTSVIKYYQDANEIISGSPTLTFATEEDMGAKKTEWETTVRDKQAVFTTWRDSKTPTISLDGTRQIVSEKLDQARAATGKAAQSAFHVVVTLGQSVIS